MSIIQNKNTKFGGKVADVKCDNFTCVVTTAKEGIFKPLSTIVHEVIYFNIRACCKVIYSDYLSKSDIQQVHDILIESINISGEEGNSLSQAINSTLSLLREKELVKEAIDIS